MNARSVGRSLAVVVSTAAAGALVWIASPYLTGEREPWDSNSAWYLAALAAIGLAAAIFTRRPFAAYAGTFAGQALYLLYGTRRGPLTVLGLFFVAAYSLLTLSIAALPTVFRATAASR